MPRSGRKRSEADIYHVIVRGEGRRILFESDEDRLVFLRMLASALDRTGARAYAWCLMENHVHLLLKVDYKVLPRLMQGLTSGYAVYYNKEHDHVGHVFAGRYNSVPVDSDEYLITVVRYIHYNPVKGGLARTCAYRWSSFPDYVKAGSRQIDAGEGSGAQAHRVFGSGASGGSERTGIATDTEFVLGVFGGYEQFALSHEVRSVAQAGEFAEFESFGARHDDVVALEIARRVIGEDQLSKLGSLDKAQRNQGIVLLKRSGLTTRQIERFTGIGRGIVDRVKWRE